MDETYLKILQMIQDGIISATEGEKLLDALEGRTESGDQSESEVSSRGVAAGGGAKSAPVGPPAWTRRVWVYPLGGGLLLLALAGMVTAMLMRAGNHLGWLVCTLPLMVFGGLVVALAWWSRTARWLHVRVRDGGKRVSISLPLPLRPVIWVVRIARPWVPQLQDTALDELILSLAEADNKEGVLAVEVNEGAGEQVQVYLG